MVEVAERAVCEGWPLGVIAEHLLDAAPGLAPLRTVATLRRVTDDRTTLGPFEATKAAVRAALAAAKAA